MNDIITEKAIISSLLKGGTALYNEYSTSLTSTSFSNPLWSCVYTCIESVIEDDFVKEVSPEMVFVKAKSLGLEKKVCTEKNIDEIKSCYELNISKEEIPIFFRRISFWDVVSKLKDRLDDSLKMVSNLSGEEKLLDVISEVEESVFNYLPEIVNNDEMVDMSQFVHEHIKYIEDNPIQSPGIPTGFPKYDKCIGGGFRRGTVNVVGARPKVGKSTFCLNICKNVSSFGVPVLYLDTEMRKETQAIKYVSLVSKVDQYDIETGKFKEKESSALSVSEAVKKIKNIPFTHSNVSGKKPQEIMSIILKWLSKVVGKNESGQTNDCLIVLDYLKTMDISDLGNVQEYQYLGDFITKIHNFAVKHDIPVLATVQLNRDGINREDGSVISGSDRILWLCSSMTFLKKKTDEDVASGDILSNGDRKMIVVDTRYGSGIDASSEYINVISNMNYCEMVEGRYNFEVINDSSIVTDSYDDEIGF